MPYLKLIVNFLHLVQLYSKPFITCVRCTSANTNSLVIYTAINFAIARFPVFKSMWVRGFTAARKRFSELKSIFVSVWRGLTCIQVELYESEGQSYELCRSGKKSCWQQKNRLLKHSYTAAAVLHRLHKLLGSKSKQTKLIYKSTL